MDKAALFVLRIPQEEIEIPGVGTIRVRGLSRHEAVVMQSVKGSQEQERLMLKFGLVDPEINEADAKAWQAASPAGELEPVTQLISRLSGMAPQSDRESYKSLPE